MRHSTFRFAALVAAVVVVASCDDGPTSSRFGNGISGGPTGTAPIVPPPPGSVDSFPPFARINTPVATPVQLINIGDDILVETRITDDRELRSMTVTGYREIGDPDLGTFQRIPRYPTIRVPVGTANFRAGLTDTTIRRVLLPASPLDTVPDELVIEVVVTDAGGNTFTAQRIVNLVTGPTVEIVNPTNGGEHPRGVPLQVDVAGEHDTGLQEITVTVTSEGTFTPVISQTQTFTFPAGTLADTATLVVPIPATAPLGGRITITASAVDINGNPGSADPVTIRLREAGILAPRVTQVVAPRLEIDDFITVHADGDGITQVGYVLVDAVTNVEFTRRDSVLVEGTSPRTVDIPLELSLAEQGRRFKVYSFAVDANATPLTGFSLANMSLPPQQVEANAFRDTTLIAHGRTYTQPRAGVIGDVAVDPLGNVFLSNTQHNLLEVWQNPVDAFAPSGIRVGALPWGLFLTGNPDTLLVANSGATTISRVFVGTTTPSAMAEDLPNRIRTRENVVFDVLLSFDLEGHIVLSYGNEYAYSDRPQYVAESEGGRIYFSTRPTDAATPGTIRWMQPTLPFPDPQQIVNYGFFTNAPETRYSIFHADSIRIGKNNGVSPNHGSDTLYVFDHEYGQLNPQVIGIDSLPLDAVAEVRALTGDAFALFNFNVLSLGLTDTTFVAASGDRRWIGFGEGNTRGGPGRVMMINDPVGPAPGFFSPAITVRDLVHNASETVFGLAIDQTGRQVVSHGLQTYMAAVDQPFHMRLEGVYDSFDNGAGVAYHPQAQSTLTPDPDHRISFSATDNGVIEIIDVAHYNNRGRLVTKGDLYGALRVSGPLPGDNVGLSCATNTRAGDDPNCIVLKVFGLSSSGLVVVNLQWKDIAPQ